MDFWFGLGFIRSSHQNSKNGIDFHRVWLRWHETHLCWVSGVISNFGVGFVKNRGPRPNNLVPSLQSLSTFLSINYLVVVSFLPVFLWDNVVEYGLECHKLCWTWVGSAGKTKTVHAPRFVASFGSLGTLLLVLFSQFGTYFFCRFQIHLELGIILSFTDRT